MAVVDVVTGYPFCLGVHATASSPFLATKSEELQRSSLRVFLASLPLADKAGGHIQIAGEDGLAGSLSESQVRICLGFRRGMGVRHIASNLRIVSLFIRSAPWRSSAVS